MPRIRRKVMSLDTEVTGVDLWHGAKPFLVTVCDSGDNQQYWEWFVNPHTREPEIPDSDRQEIQSLLNDPGIEWVLQNAKFDVRALATIGIEVPEGFWDRCHDLLYSAHLLGSNKPKDLTTQALQYLVTDIKPFEDALEKAVKEARSSCSKDWKLARKGLPEMPSCKEKTWRFDYWVPRALARHENLPADHRYWYVANNYANADSAVTVHIRERHQSMLEERGLVKLYQERLRLLPIVVEMEDSGITVNSERLEELEQKYQEESDRSGKVCCNIATGYDSYELKLPKTGNNKSLHDFCFEKLKLEPLGYTPTGKPSLDKTTLEMYELSLSGNSKPSVFVRNLAAKRKRDTALTYMKGYRRFWLPIEIEEDDQTWYLLHSKLNPVGTDTLRWSSNDPNEQNVSKKEGFNLRYAFGPTPGREWWSLDYENLELRIPAYESREPAMLELFEHPEKPPYYGSYHLLIFSILHPDKYDHNDSEGLLIAKDKFKSTWYQWTKNGNFAELYGAVETSGTADRAFHMPGAQAIVAKRLTEKSKLNKYWIDFAERHGYVETIPDKSIDSKRGYPLLCTRSNYGKILPTVPLNYHVQGTACWLMMRAMIKIREYLRHLKETTGFDGRMIMNVHDEVVLDFPAGGARNLEIVNRIKAIMESIGDDIGIPLKASVSYHPISWDKSEDPELVTVA